LRFFFCAAALLGKEKQVPPPRRRWRSGSVGMTRAENIEAI